MLDPFYDSKTGKVYDNITDGYPHHNEALKERFERILNSEESKKAEEVVHRMFSQIKEQHKEENMWPGKSDVKEEVDTPKFLTKAEFDVWTAGEAMIDDLRLLCNEAINMRLVKLEQQIQVLQKYILSGPLSDEIRRQIIVEEK